VDNSSLTGIGLKKLQYPREDYTFSSSYYLGKQPKNTTIWQGSTALFYQGDFRGLQASGSDYGTREYISDPDEPEGLIPSV
jgi:hypothetical protein